MREQTIPGAPPPGRGGVDDPALVDGVLRALDRGTPPSAREMTAWLRGLPDAVAAVRHVSLAREHVLSSRPDAGKQLDEVLGSLFDAALEQLAQRALDDALNDCVTGLPTRRMFERDCQRALAASARSTLPLAVVMVDVDGLKTVNDTLGHPAGDRHLRAVAEALQSLVREGDGAYRVGGDEFVLLLAGATGADAASVMARYSGPGISWGVASSREASADTGSLLAEADAHMYRERRASRSSTSRPQRPRAGGLAVAGLAVLAAVSTGALVVVASGTTLDQPRGPATAGSTRMPPVQAPAPAARAVEQAPRAAAPGVAAPASGGAAAATPVRQVAGPVTGLPTTTLPPLPGLPIGLPGTQPPSLAQPQPSADPAFFPVVLDETVTLVSQTICRLLC